MAPRGGAAPGGLISSLGAGPPALEFPGLRSEDAARAHSRPETGACRALGVYWRRCPTPQRPPGFRPSFPKASGPKDPAQPTGKAHCLATGLGRGGEEVGGGGPCWEPLSGGRGLGGGQCPAVSDPGLR